MIVHILYYTIILNINIPLEMDEKPIIDKKEN